MELSDGRAPRGARGLKWLNTGHGNIYVSRAPRGARGLKYSLSPPTEDSMQCRAPRGARGLKLPLRRLKIVLLCVVPLAGHVD